MSTALVTTTPATAELYRQATDVAGVCKEIVLKTAMEIQGRKYVKVEGWQSIATAHGCTASARDVERVEGGVRAIGEIRRMSDGIVIATAEGFVGEDEPTWFGGEVESRYGAKTLPKRPDYAIRAMCQTRAISRACRTAFAHVVVLMDADLSTTPAEEVPSGGFQDNAAASTPAPARQAAPTAAPRTVSKPAATAGAAKPAGKASDWHNVEIHFGKNKGVKLGDLGSRQLEWYVTEWQPKPYKGAIAEADQILRAALDQAAGELDGSKAAPEGSQPDAQDSDEVPF